ncbi:unnamed protein product [Dibothriocephalus latus]|uniref:Uncharacterized protein n=1 Tax=Dibothriocephalus latus TaxID=60516 RepID=A0A3P6V6Y2_DIBLA|nr:unnamed protein product [Dibothriocephalus latus]
MTAVNQSEEPSNSVGESGVPIPTLNQEALQLRIRIIEQFHLLAAIIGRWLLPLNGISSDQLSELLLINIGTAADILDLFEAFNEEAVIKHFPIQISILCLWQASLLQFCFNKTARLEVEDTQTPSNLNSGQHNAFQASAVEDTNQNFGMASPTKKKTHQSSRLDETEPQTEYSAQHNSFQASELEETSQNFGIVSPTKKETDESIRLNEMEAQTEYIGQHNASQASALEDINQNYGMASPTKKATHKSSRLDETEPQTEYSESSEGDCCCCGGFWHRHERCRNVLFGTELWAIIMTLMLQDLPFMCLRLTLIFAFAVRSYQNIFFAIKNMILILAQVFRCWVLLRNYGPNYHMMDWSHIIFRIR